MRGQITVTIDNRVPRTRAAEDGAQTRLELREIERLKNVIVRTRVETAHLGLNAVACREDQRGRSRWRFRSRRSTSIPSMSGRPRSRITAS